MIVNQKSKYPSTGVQLKCFQLCPRLWFNIDTPDSLLKTLQYNYQMTALEVEEKSTPERSTKKRV